MICPDCNGTKVYQGLGAPEPCKACGGTGEIIHREVHSTAEVAKEYGVPRLANASWASMFLRMQQLWRDDGKSHIRILPPEPPPPVSSLLMRNCPHCNSERLGFVTCLSCGKNLHDKPSSLDTLRDSRTAWALLDDAGLVRFMSASKRECEDVMAIQSPGNFSIREIRFEFVD